MRLTTLRAFCGFYVAKADTKLFNKASQVVLVRDGDRTVLTMANDFKGDPKEFAIVIPVPTVLEKGQIHVGDKALVDHLDAYSAPRLVEYFDENPCERRVYETRADGGGAGRCRGRRHAPARRRLGVTIEAQYTVGEYDILILSATQSAGLETWLRENGYRIPPGAVGGARQLHHAEHAVLRREGEPRRAGEARLLLPPAAPGRLRVAEVHAARSASGW